MSDEKVIFSTETKRNIMRLSASGVGRFELPASGFDILQMVMYPTILSQSGAGSFKARLYIYQDGNLTDVMEQRWPHSSADPDIMLGMFLVELNSEGYGYECEGDFQEDLDGEGNDVDKILSALVGLKIEILGD